MERGSDKHGPGLDDQLKHEEGALLKGVPDESRTEPRRQEAPGPGEPGMGMRDDQDEIPGGAPSQREIEQRAAFAASFTPSLFPARKDALIEDATGHFADQRLIRALQEVPDREYETVGALWEAVRERSG